jgi:hypothetical protein
VNRLMEELGKNERVTDALARAMEAKGKVDERTRKTLGTVGLAAADQLEGLRNQIEVLEKRLAALEKSEKSRAGGTAATKRSATAKKPTAAKPRTSGARTTTPKSPPSSPETTSGTGTSGSETGSGSS